MQNGDAPLAVIDVGSNSVRLLIARPLPGGHLEILDDAHGLVEGLAADEAPGEAAPAPHAVARGEVLERATSGQREEQSPRQGVQQGRGVH